MNKAVWIFVTLYTLAAILVSVNRYWQYQTSYFDFGIFDTALWKVSRFQPPIVDHVDISYREEVLILGDHFSPSIFLLSPLYWLTDKREIILIAQVLAVVLAAWVGYKIAWNTLKNKVAVLALIVAFLGYVGTQNALISDFHQDTVAVLPLMLTFWAINKKKWRLFFLFLIILLGFKESFAGLGVALGLFILIRRINLKVALATILISLSWFLIIVGYLIPTLSGTYLYSPKELPSGFSELISRISQPLRVQTVFYTFLTFAFLPIFDLAVLPGILENFFERYVVANRGSDLGMHYNATLAPFLFMGALYILTRLEKKFNTKIISMIALIIITLVVILHRFIIHGPLGLAYNPVFYQQNKGVKYVDDFVKNFPKDGLIMTQNDLAVRLTHQNVKLLRTEYKLINPDYVILNLTEGQNPNGFFPITYKAALELKEELLLDSNYTLKKYTDEQYIFSRK